MAKQQVVIPDLGSDDDVDVIEVLVKVGDVVEVDQSLAVLESAKASMEVPSSHAGTVSSVVVKVGDKVNTGSVVVELEVEGEAQAEPAAEAVPVATESAAAEPAAPVSPAAAVETAPAVQAAAPAATADIDVAIPELGSDDDVDVIEVLVKVGEVVEIDQSLVVLESAKASMEVPSTAAGTVKAVKVKVGDKVNTGSVVVVLEGEAQVQPSAAAAAPATEAPAVAASAVPAVPHLSPEAAKAAEMVRVESSALKPVRALAPAQTVSVAPKDGPSVYAGPAVRKLARELGADLHEVKATGPRGRILQEDVTAHVKALVQQLKNQPAKAQTAAAGSGIPAVPAVDFAKFGEIEKIPMSRIDKITRDNMHRAWLNVPHVTQWDEADVTELEAFRASLKGEMDKRGVRITPLAFLLKAVAATLEAEPKFNRSLDADGEHIVQKHYVHIGIAVDTPNGLLVPVLRDVNKKGLWQIAEETNVLAKKARDGKLLGAEMQGASFTISSLGAMGGNGFTPIVNTPEVGILGVSKTQVKPVWNGKEFVPRSMLPLTLSYDHRAINGADAGRFMTHLVKVIADIRHLLL